MNNDIKKGTIIRTIALALALINQILTAFGHSAIPVSDAQVQEIVSLTFTIVMSAVTWWKNQSFSKEAITADRVMQALKSGAIDPKLVLELVDNIKS